MVGWRHCLNGHEFEQALGDGGGQGSLGCCGHGVINPSNSNNKCPKQMRAARGKGDKSLIKTELPPQHPHPSTQKAAFWESLLL